MTGVLLGRKNPLFSACPLFGGDEADSQKVPRVIIAPGRYIQGPGTLDHLGRYISVLPSRRPAVLLSRGGQARFGDKIQRALAREGAGMVVRLFEGECSYEAVEGLAASLRAESEAKDLMPLRPYPTGKSTRPWNRSWKPTPC